MGRKKKADGDSIAPKKKRTMSIVPVEDSRTVTFSVSFEMNGAMESKTFGSRADLFSWVRGAEMFGVSPGAIVRTVSQNVKIERSE